MSLQGRIEDVAVADVMQLIRVGGHSGTLSVRSGDVEALIGFERGRIVSAWSPHSPRLGELLVSAGVIDEHALARALQVQESERPRRTIGQVLTRMNAASPDAIRQALTQEIERVVTQILSWPAGTFEFALDDLTPVVEVTRFTGAPNVDLDTQQVLLSALQLMEEQAARAELRPPQERDVNPADVLPDEPIPVAVASGAPQDSRSWAETGPTRVEAEPAAVEALESGESTEPVWPERPRFQLVSHDSELLARLNQSLASDGDRITTVALRDAGVSLLGEPPPIVVIDMRNQAHSLEAVSALCRTRPRASVIAVFEGRASLRELYSAGVVSICSVDTVAACMRSMARQRKYLSIEHAVAEGVRASFARLHRIIADLRSGLLSTSASLNLLHVLSESIDRGVLLIPERNQLIAMGAFGRTTTGETLTERTRSLAFSAGRDGVLAACLGDSRTRRATYESARLPSAFAAVVDRPVTGEIVVLPVPGSERVIAVIYLDNGARERPLADIEVFELAAFQLGLALENEALRRSRPNS